MANEVPALASLPGLSSRASLIADAIRDSILKGIFPPGTELVERQLAEMFGISKTPVREALISLARSGLITMSPNRGSTVRVLDEAAVRSIYEMRLLLEPHAVRRATEDFPSRVLKQARQTLEDARDAIDRADYGELSLVNRRFHRLLYSACGNPLIVVALDEVQDQLALLAVSMLWRDESPSWEQEYQEHRRLCDAVGAGDAERAAELMTAHIEASLEKTRVS
ncbi:GntR family transcriptional regulator [Amycolatopsis acidiphila]|uniref:GntR family transcriptional regulator n=1 Tax=Amycolatopsis acidiphila TaxID=715473 RepID=A0A558AJA8_9PSEU|nr:GntR family transcriptional regulator [Amycolatopsis acidiphila]TVT24339.1 GntR family transcriptional regulator [Amycolatopsis acidiphila]UIJ62525.1 GntR family transcriptional regulator [Amycolatopsis acidiphila]GHG85203.1 GntR family transcriptional regulator [Amycolatopsis acidiphila]